MDRGPHGPDSPEREAGPTIEGGPPPDWPDWSESDSFESPPTVAALQAWALCEACVRATLHEGRAILARGGWISGANLERRFTRRMHAATATETATGTETGTATGTETGTATGTETGTATGTETWPAPWRVAARHAGRRALRRRWRRLRTAWSHCNGAARITNDEP